MESIVGIFNSLRTPNAPRQFFDLWYSGNAHYRTLTAHT